MTSSLSAATRHGALLSALVLSFPVAVWAKDSLYSICRVRGTSMEPALKDGDVVLVRKSDLLPGIAKERHGVYVDENENDNNNNNETDRARLLRIESSVMGGTQPSWLWNKPPLALGGDVVVFCSPNEAYPHEYHVKRVVGLGGQVVRPARHQWGPIEAIPRYSLWVEGDNANNSSDSGTYGPISKKLLVGQAERIVWPPSRWGLVEKKAPPHGRAWWP